MTDQNKCRYALRGNSGFVTFRVFKSGLIILISIMIFFGFPACSSEDKQVESTEEFLDAGKLITERQQAREKIQKKVVEELRPTVIMTFHDSNIVFDDQEPMNLLNDWDQITTVIDEIIAQKKHIRIIYKASNPVVASHYLWKLKDYILSAPWNPIIEVRDFPQKWAQEMVNTEYTEKPL